ncbi:MAG: hypothetical protein HZT43_19190 [Exiguobacterium profundum]|nr:MAG: hypothetical protein HZT43_19190 [Exiguobacterium profundum]
MPRTDDVQAAFAAVSAILREGRLAELPAAAIALETALRRTANGPRPRSRLCAIRPGA